MKYYPSRTEIKTDGTPLIDSQYYLYYNNLRLLLLFVNGKCVGASQGENAMHHYNLINGDNGTLIQNLLSIIGKVSGFTHEQLSEKDRNQYRVWSRSLVMGALHALKESKTISITIEEITNLFSRHHATIYNVVYNVMSEDRYLQPWQIDYRNEFLRLLSLKGYNVELIQKS